MTDMHTQASDNRKRRKVIGSAVFGALAGFGVSFALLSAIDAGSLGEIDTSRALAAMVGAIHLLCGALVGAGLLNPRLGAKFLNVEDADELREQQQILFYSVLGIAAFGLALLLLAFAAPAGPIPEPVAAGAVAALMVVATIASWLQFKAMDELHTSLAIETASTAFYIVFCLGGGWSVAAHLGFAPGLAALDWLTLLGGSTLVAAFWATGRRGMLAVK